MDKTKTSRRNFLLAAGLSGAATVAVIAAKTGPQDVTSKQKKKDAKEGGYQLSDHVRRYYRTTLV